MNRTMQADLNIGSPSSVPNDLGRLNFGSVLMALFSPTIDSANRTVTTHVHEMTDSSGNAEYGIILGVQVTAGGTTGAFKLTCNGTPNTGEVKVEFTAGRPKLTFAAGDAVTACRCYWIKWPNARDNSTQSLYALMATIVGG
jgi:hypothetical protein